MNSNRDVGGLDVVGIDFLGGMLDGQGLYHVVSTVSHFQNEFGSTKMSS